MAHSYDYLRGLHRAMRLALDAATDAHSVGVEAQVRCDAAGAREAFAKYDALMLLADKLVGETAPGKAE